MPETLATDHAPFWRASTNIVHRVREVRVDWTRRERPRLTIVLWCSVPPRSSRRAVDGLTDDASWGKCSRCF